MSNPKPTTGTNRMTGWYKESTPEEKPPKNEIAVALSWTNWWLFLIWLFLILHNLTH